jgi:protein TonB
VSLVARKQADRRVARQRIAHHAQQNLTSAQRAFDPLARPSQGSTRRRVWFVVGVLGSLLIHVAAIGVGIGWRQNANQAARQQVTIEMRPPPPPPEEKPAPAPPKVAKAPPPPVAPPTKAPPVRIVGLSMESATEGGDGPAFAVGNTRLGETAQRATAPKDVTPAPSGVPGPTRAAGPGRSNQAASHIPVAGVKYELPKRKRPQKPDYPATLKSQGIEEDIPVLVNIDAEGKVTSVKILKESTYPAFNDSARAAALAEEFEPATRDGVAMPYSLSFKYKFRLEEE